MMNISRRKTIVGATAFIAVLLGTAACGDESVVTDTGSVGGFGARPHPKTDAKSGSVSADSAERKAAAEKARQDKASAARYDRSTHNESQLKNAGHPGRP